ncbi:MAG: CHAT domain-containing protein, partial [Armatimonadetes bacterium]|nr:CHAT domain-containing protein [Armatimonadota bacterium]
RCIELTQQALELFRKLEGTESDQAGCLVNLGGACLATDRPADALATLAEAERMYRRVQRAAAGKGERWVPGAMCVVEAGIGRAYRLRGLEGDLYRAYRHCARAVCIIEDLRGRAATTPELKASYFAKVAWVYDLLIGVLLEMKRQGLGLKRDELEEQEKDFWKDLGLEMPRLWEGWESYEEAMLHYAEAGRARVAQDLLANQPLWLADRKSRRLWQRFNELVAQEAALQQALVGGGSRLAAGWLDADRGIALPAKGGLDQEAVAALRGSLGRVSAERERVEAELWSTAFGQLARPPALRLKNVQGLLRDGQALVEYKILEEQLVIVVVSKKGVRVYEVDVPAAGPAVEWELRVKFTGEGVRVELSGEEWRASLERMEPTRPLLRRLAQTWREAEDKSRAAREIGLVGLVFLAREPMEAALGRLEPVQSPGEHLQVLAALYELLLRPLHDQAEKEKLRHLIVVPDGALHYLPLAMLVERLPERFAGQPGQGEAEAGGLREEGGRGPQAWPYADPGLRYALERWDISYLPSVNMYAAMLKLAAGRPEPTRRVCVFADPVFSAEDERVKERVRQGGEKVAVGSEVRPAATREGAPEDGSEQMVEVAQVTEEYWRERGLSLAGLSRLKLTAEEAKWALEAFGGDAKSAWTEPVAPAKWAAQQAFLGLGAVEPRVYEPELQQYGYLLLSTHGCIVADNPMYSFLALTPQEVVAAAGLGEAGPAPASSDGTLTLGELFGLQMNARMVSLSACQTGLGQYRRGEGMIGLVLALFQSGARAATVSLWRVAEQHTAVLMGAYHRAMAGGQAPLPALLAAQRAMLDAGRQAAATLAAGPAAGGEADQWQLTMAAAGTDPYFWAPFVLVGQW